MKSLEDYLGCGTYYPKSTQDVGDFVVSRFTDIRYKIITFFDENPIIGVKSKDYSDFTYFFFSYLSTINNKKKI